MAPGTAGASLTAPALPSALAGYAPQVGTSHRWSTVIAVDGMTAYPTYGSFVPTASSYVGFGNQCSFGQPLVPPLAGPGQVVLAVYTDGGGC